MLNKFIVYLLVSFIGLFVLTQISGDYYIRAMLPVYEQVIHIIKPQYNIISLNLIEQNKQSLIELKVEYTKRRYIGTSYVEKGTKLNSRILSGNVIQHIFLILSPLIAWILIIKKQRAKILFMGSIAILVLEIMDAPYMLVGSIEDVVLFEVV